MCLFLVVDLSFIGQVTVAVLVLFGAGDALALLDRVPHAAGIPLLSTSSAVLFAIVALVAAWSIALFDVPLGALRSFCQWITRITIGVIPNRVFTEVQLYGIYLYRVVAECEDGTQRELVRTFELDGGQGPMQRWRPRMFLKFTYEVTDYCLRYHRDGVREAQATIHYSAVKALMHAAFDELTAQRQSGRRLVLYVKSIDADETARRHEGRFTMSEWIALLECRVSGGSLTAPVHLADPPPIKKTLRIAL
jgi:hypothetical protein